MNKLQIVKPERRVARRGPPFRDSRDFQRHVESEVAFHLMRASDRAVGPKSWREKKIRSGARVPLRNEAEVFRALLDRAVEQGDMVMVERAINEVDDAMVLLIRLTSRLKTDARRRAAERVPDWKRAA